MCRNTPVRSARYFDDGSRVTVVCQVGLRIGVSGNVSVSPGMECVTMGIDREGRRYYAHQSHRSVGGEIMAQPLREEPNEVLVVVFESEQESEIMVVQG